MRLAVRPDDKGVRLFLSPLNRPLRPVDFNEQIVLAAMTDLRSGHRAERAVLELNEGRAVIIDARPCSNVRSWQLISLGSKPVM